MVKTNLRNFNSHAHVERDLVTLGLALQTIHFNSHAHVERDIENLVVPIVSRYFNSHAHVERDCGYFLVLHQSVNFNSHAHVERDIPDTMLPLKGNISTHTLTWSVTSKKCTFT